jgi:hypothetical protein
MDIIQKSRADSTDGARSIALYEENDKISISNQDRYYTQGIRFSYQNHPNYFYALTQEINTPANTTDETPESTDLPYSAALYGTYGYGKISKQNLYILEGALGVIGPSALGEFFQNKFHDLIGVSESMGWGTQKPDTPVLNVNVEFRRRLKNIIARSLLQVGTMRTQAIFGVHHRLNTDDVAWGRGTIRNSSAFNPVIDRGNTHSTFFFDAQVEIVKENYATGSVKQNSVISQVTTGTEIVRGKWDIAYHITARSKEFATQLSNHSFGNLTLKYNF